MSKQNGDTSPQDGGVAVRLFRLTNRLKKKITKMRKPDDTPGFLAPEAIAEADALITELCEDCPAAMNKHFKALVAAWTKMRDMPDGAERKEQAQDMFTVAHEIKDISALCGYDLVSYFAESLRDFVAGTELKLEAQRVIIQAHIDALNVVLKQGIKTDGGAQAEELKKMVKIAIDKYR